MFDLEKLPIKKFNVIKKCYLSVEKFTTIDKNRSLDPQSGRLDL